MVGPGLVAVSAPVIAGFALGWNALGGLLAGSLVTGVLMALFMNAVLGIMQRKQLSKVISLSLRKETLRMMQQ